MASLLEKNGLICREIARDPIHLDAGRKVKTTSEYARLLRAGQGTIQKAFRRLEDMQAIALESRGHLGTYLAAKDLCSSDTSSTFCSPGSPLSDTST
jgi:DNA-binding transcriptional regulator YhcF (GntR family)